METTTTIVGPAVNEISSLVTVDRSVKPTYPDWFKRLIRPDLECAGPAQFDICEDVEYWYSRSQLSTGFRGVEGEVVYRRIRETNVISSCLNLQDGLAIQARGVAFFDLFVEPGAWLCLWGSAAENVFGKISVPCLYKKDNEIIIRWRCVKQRWFEHHPAMRWRNLRKK